MDTLLKLPVVQLFEGGTRDAVNARVPDTASWRLTMQVQSTCSIEGCGRPIFVKSRPWCMMHYSRWQRTGDPIAFRRERDPARRFWARVDKRPDGCWLWTGALTEDGYGRFSVSKTVEFKAHRWAYEAVSGPIPAGMQLDHVCHTRDADCVGSRLCPHRRCVNPTHLEVVTPRENVLRSQSFVAENTRKTECPQGHPYDEANTYIVPGTGERCCLFCRRKSIRESAARARARRRG